MKMPLDKTSTSFVERSNLSVRNHLRRFTRRGTGFSKSLKHHAAMVAIFVAWFNLCRVHETIRCTPAMEAGLTDHVWSVAELVEAAIAAEPCDAPEPSPLAPRPGAQKTTARTTSTGVTLRVVDCGKTPPRAKERELRPGEQTTILDVLGEARRQEERGKSPPDEPEGGGK